MLSYNEKLDRFMKIARRDEAIRIRYAQGERVASIAKDFGLTQGRISQICSDIITAQRPGPAKRKEQRDR